MRDSEIIFAVKEAPEGGYEARAMEYPIFTQAETIEELREMARDAVDCHFADEAPAAVKLRFVAASE